MIVSFGMLLASLAALLAFLLAFSFVRQPHVPANKTYHNPVLPHTEVAISLIRFDQ